MGWSKQTNTGLLNKQCQLVFSGFSHVRLCNPVDYSLPGSSVHGTQARILEWVAISFSNVSLVNFRFVLAAKSSLSSLFLSGNFATQ